MEDVYTIKVKTKPDTRNLYPSERRYSASTVSGLGWVHIALGSTSCLLACLAIVNPNEEQYIEKNDTDIYNSTFTSIESNNNYILILAPILLTVFAIAAGIASILASVRWYIDKNITILFIMSTLSTLVSIISFSLIIVWLIESKSDISEFYKEKVPFKDIFVLKHTDVIDRNESHFVVMKNTTEVTDNGDKMFTKRVLAINILIAAFLELLWCILSVKVSYKGMKSNYNNDERRGNCIAVTTTIKGNTRPRNKLRSDLINTYPNKKIQKIFLAQNDSGFYLKNQNNKTKQNTETSSEFYKERMINFLNRCASLEGVSNPEITPSVQSDTLNPIPEVVIDTKEKQESNKESNRITPVSWGDSPDHTIYNQNTLNFEKIFSFRKKNNVKKDDSEIAKN